MLLVQKETLKTAYSYREIPVEKYAMDILQKHREKQNKQKERLGSAYQDNDLVFCSPTGTHLDHRGVQRSFQTSLFNANCRHIRFHDIRHTHAPLLLLSGTPMHIVFQRLGHSNIRITLEHYAHYTLAGEEQAIACFGKLLRGQNQEFNVPEIAVPKK